MNKIKTAEHFLVLQIIFCVLAFSNAKISSKIGINYGRQGNNLPSPYETIQILQWMNADIVKLHDTDHEILHLLSGKKIQAAITVVNELISDIASNQTFVDQWIQENVLAFYPDTMIRYIFVGNEVLSQKDPNLWNNLVPAMRRIHDAVRAHNIENIKVGAPQAMDILESTFPPSSGTFRPDIPLDQVLIPLLKFLDGSSSIFFLNVFPYLEWSANPMNVSLKFALFRSDQNDTYKDTVSGLNYTNLLDQMLDSVIFAAERVGFDDINLAISETGWPHDGDIDQPGTSIYNSATYNRNLVSKMTAKPAIGTPARPSAVIPTFIYSLFDENKKDGPATERNWGILHSNGLPIYDLNLTGGEGDGDYPELPPPLNDKPYKGKLWCVVATGVNISYLDQAMGYVCSHGNGTCDAIAPGRECYQPVSLIAQASYAFSSYWAQFRSTGEACYFNGLAMQTIRDPSHGTCIYPSVTV